MDHPLGRDHPAAEPPYPLETAEAPVEGALYRNAETHTSPINDAPLTGPSLDAHNPAPSYDSPVHSIPTELLLIILQLVAPSRTREDLYTLLSLTHVCQFWRALLVQRPQAWTTIFATRYDRRSFVEMCLKRSQPLPLEATVDIIHKGSVPTGCKCTSEDEYGRLLRNRKTPCEWHFVFEPLARPENSKRIQVLNTDCSNPSYPGRTIEFGSFRFLGSSFPQLTTFEWKDDGTQYANRLFPRPHHLPNLRFLAFEGRWNPSLAQISNLTSLSVNYRGPLCAERFRLFLLNNKSLEWLELSIKIRGVATGPPVDLPNLKSLSTNYSFPKAVSTIIRVPAFEHFSSLRISLEDDLGDFLTLRATGDGISLTVKSWVQDVAEDWQYLTGHARPALHVRIYDQLPVYTFDYSDISMIVPTLMGDAHTLDIGLSYSILWGDRFWRELKRLGPRLKTMRFEVSEKVELFGDSTSFRYVPDDYAFDKITELVEHRFREGWPLSTVERMIVSDDEEVNRLQDCVWRRFCDARGIRKYLASG